MSGHYANWLNAIFDADQIVERTFRANKPNLLMQIKTKGPDSITENVPTTQMRG
jgi:hypothetical protein